MCMQAWKFKQEDKEESIYLEKNGRSQKLRNLPLWR